MAAGSCSTHGLRRASQILYSEILSERRELTGLLAVVAQTLGRGAHLGIVADVATLVAGATRQGRHFGDCRERCQYAVLIEVCSSFSRLWAPGTRRKRGRPGAGPLTFATFFDPSRPLYSSSSLSLLNSSSSSSNFFSTQPTTPDNKERGRGQCVVVGVFVEGRWGKSCRRDIGIGKQAGRPRETGAATQQSLGLASSGQRNPAAFTSNKLRGHARPSGALLFNGGPPDHTARS